MANVNIGPEVLSEGTAPIKADIVFVHGLMGDRLKTWTKDEVSWPRDLLPYDIDNARIITWGYNADVMTFFQRTSQSSIFQHALSLLQDIQRERQTDEEVARPLIFVGHSLGGLVIKQALCKAHEYKITRATHRHSRMGAIFDKAFGIVFVGTPHRGTDQKSWISIANNLAQVLSKDQRDYNDRIIEALTWGSEVLEGLQDSFAGILDHFSIHSVLEEQKASKFGKVVDDTSACLGVRNETLEWIPATHIEMCKFSSRLDIGYRRLSGSIRELVHDCCVEDPAEHLRSAAASPAYTASYSPFPTSRSPQPPSSDPSRSKSHLSSVPATTVETHEPSAVLEYRNSADPVFAFHQFRIDEPKSEDHHSVNDQPASSRYVADEWTKSELSLHEDATSLCDAVQSEDICLVQGLLSSGIDPKAIIKSVPAIHSKGGLMQRWLGLWEIDDLPREMTAIHYALESPSEAALALLKMLLGAAPASSVEVLGGTKMVLELNNSPRNKKNSGMFTVWGNNSIDGSSVETYSPLAWAAIMDNAEGMQWLLQSGAEVDSQRNVNGLTALMAQATCNPIPGGQLITAAMLLQAGVSLDLRDPAGYTALHAALYMYNCELAAILIDAGAEVNAASARGITPLHACATMGSKQRESAQIILLLLDKGAETDATDIGGLTPYWIAKRGGNTYAADALKGRKGDSAVHDVMALRRSILRAFK